MNDDRAEARRKAEETFRDAEPTGPDPFGPNGPSDESKDDLSWLKFERVDQLPDIEDPIIIKGLLHLGEKMGITAGSKKFKTWLLLYLGYCVANGLPILGFQTVKSKVIYFDLELSRNGVRRRLEKIQKAVGQGDFDNFTVCSLRGKAVKFCANFPKISTLIKDGGFKLVIIDPVYKFLLGKNESDNGVVADLLERMTVFCMETQVSMIFVHHHSKGNQSAKDSLDRSSGAGSWSRDPDAVLDLYDHQDSTPEEKIYAAEITVREFPPIENFVVRWRFPLLVRDDQGLDPTELKQPKKGSGRPGGDTETLIITALRTAECVAGLNGLTAKQLETSTHANLRTIQRHIKQLLDKRRIAKCVAIDGYQLSTSERNNTPTEEKL